MVTAGLAAAIAAAAPPIDCRNDLLPGRVSTATSTRTVGPLDLARLRDFGGQDLGLAGDAPFSLSPDGRTAAIVLRRGDPARDAYCMGVALVPLDGSGKARLVDVGGEFIVEASDVRGIPDLPIGTAEPVTPVWSPDGRWLAYLRRDGGRTRVWRARADGSGATPVSGSDANARGVRWSADGHSLLVALRPGIAEGEKAIDAEERTGFLYDRRFWTLSLARPKPPAPIAEAEQRIDPENGRVLETKGAADPEAGKPAGAIAFARSATGALAWTSPDDRSVVMGPTALRVDIGGRTIVCRSSYCADGVGKIWWSDEGTLFFLQAGTSENGGTTRLLRWLPLAEAAPTLILSTIDALIGCRPGAGAIVCAREAATRPRVLTRIDPATGAMADLFDPNPEFGALIKGPATRLRWRDPAGVASYGDLVLPPGHRPGERHPLVVVQYRSHGFLRGGTGDEYPIQAFAARGFAVLSVERTRFVAAGVARDFPDFMRISTKDFAERRRALSSVEAGVRTAIATGAIDSDRIGITGVSDGAATVQFALVNSKLFRVAAMSSCCDEPSSSLFAADPGYAEMLIAAGFPPPGTDGRAFWGRYSLAANAARLRTPILLQLTDDEFRFGLETYATLDWHHVPVEMYVFAHEYHQKWRPAHRLASYVRALDWFDFWLNGRSDPASTKQAQYARWRALKARTPR